MAQSTIRPSHLAQVGDISTTIAYPTDTGPHLPTTYANPILDWAGPVEPFGYNAPEGLQAATYPTDTGLAPNIADNTGPSSYEGFRGRPSECCLQDTVASLGASNFIVHSRIATFPTSLLLPGQLCCSCLQNIHVPG